MCTVLNYRIYFKKQGRQKKEKRGKKWLWNITRDERERKRKRTRESEWVYTQCDVLEMV